MKGESKFSAKYRMKLKISFLLCVLAVSQAQVQAEETTEMQQPISNSTGKTAPKKPLNNIAFFANEQPNIVICSGALIHYKWIVTVASSVKKYGFSELRFRHGGDLGDPGSSDHFSLGSLIYEIIPHPSYAELTRTNDIALVNTLENVPVQPYKITKTNPNIIDLAVILRGYGPLNTAVEKQPIVKLSEASTKLTSSKQCRKYDTTLPSNKLCSIRARICKGDQGGPLVMNSSTNEIIGVTSVSTNTDSLCDFGVTPIETYTNIFIHREWITQTLGITNI